ncbi:MAG: DUF1640 domain-containing protein [Alphaproteobacteria bacterium]|nr:DUF1640 domain-containing protein [Alphaproteobacteria bacterium]
MNAIPFDILKLADRLQAGGFTSEQAHTAASVLVEVTSGAELATKSDITALKSDIEALRAATKSDIEALRSEMATKNDMAALRAEVKSEFTILRADVEISKRDTKIWFGSAMVVAVSIILAAMRYFLQHP